MTPEQQAALEATAAELAASLQPADRPITLESIHARLVAVENHPALSVPALDGQKENQPPIDNEYVAEGCEQFSEQEHPNG